MNREVKFCGKRVDNGEWVYGSLIEDKYIVGKVVDWEEDYFNTEFWWKVIPETVGQFTGLLDKNDKEIYEGDIVRDRWNSYTPIYQNAIYMAYNAEKINDLYVSTQFNIIWRNGCEVIGNIHDNPELLEVDQDN